MKKLILTLFLAIFSFSTVTTAILTPQHEVVAKSKQALFKNGQNKVKTYLYSQTKAYKKVKLVFRGQYQDKNGDIYLSVYEDRPERHAEFFIDEFKLTKQSGYKKLYKRDYLVPNGKFKLVKKFKK